MSTEPLLEAPASVEVTYVGQGQPESWEAAVYLCGPTPTDPEEPSWRPSAVAALRTAWKGPGRLTVFLPEPAAGGSYPPYADQIAWEEQTMRRSDVVLFWIPREMNQLPGLVSNIKWGAWYDSGRAVLGAPPEAERMAYLLHFAEAFGVPVERTLQGAVGAALRAVGRGSHRTGGERAVPLAVWRSEPFQRWYATRRMAGCRLLDARVEWYERAAAPDADPAWLLTVTIAPADGSAPSVCRLLSAHTTRRRTRPGHRRPRGRRRCGNPRRRRPPRRTRPRETPSSGEGPPQSPAGRTRRR
ncbi:hypothetical protein GCM10010499_19750 [Streptomyces thermoviolaceus subsp. apingens]|nr:hypothetical protein GCM10010499_19750 [Streptomyces thermoviolaceus subsp. apingens]